MMKRHFIRPLTAGRVVTLRLAGLLMPPAVSTTTLSLPSVAPSGTYAVIDESLQRVIGAVTVTTTRPVSRVAPKFAPLISKRPLRVCEVWKDY